MSEEKDILSAMLGTICYRRDCRDCPLYNRCVSSLKLDRGEYTDDECNRIVAAYTELYPDGSLSLPAAIVTENDISNIFNRF